MPLSFVCAAAMAIDGDTLRCANIEDANGRVRLARIDAPELPTKEGKAAKEKLASLLIGRVECEEVDALPQREGYQGRDPYGRIVAYCHVDWYDLGEEMIKAGMARHWP